MNQAVLFPRGKRLHIVGAHDMTICAKEIPEDSKYYDYDPCVPDYCNKCYEMVGREMLGEYLGVQFFRKEESQEDG